MLLSVALFASPVQSDRGDTTARVLIATSLDGHYRALVYPLRAVHCLPNGEGETLNAVQVLAVTDLRTGRYVGGYMGMGYPSASERTEKRAVAFFATPKFSLDARSVYIIGRDTLCETRTWRDRPSVYRIDLLEPNPRAAHFVTDGRLIAILRTGPHAGSLLVEQPDISGNGPVVLFGPSGKRILTVPGSAADSGAKSLAAWLKANGWTSY